MQDTIERCRMISLLVLQRRFCLGYDNWSRSTLECIMPIVVVVI